MEEFSQTCRFILTTNHPSKIIPPLHSRCQGTHFDKIDHTEFTARVANINGGIDISIKNLSFSYNENKDILKDISFDIKAKEKIAIIGSSGSGKTTIAHIISGFYSKKSGDILYNQISIDNINRQTLREKIFLVLQMPILFNNTLRFNITMGDLTISDEKIFEALKIAQLYDIVKNMQNGLDTIVGKHGIRLSGGQRQRLS